MFSAEHEAEVAAKYLDVPSHEGGVSFKIVCGMLRVIVDRKGPDKNGWHIDYLERDAAEALRDKLNEWYPAHPAETAIPPSLLAEVVAARTRFAYQADEKHDGLILALANHIEVLGRALHDAEAVGDFASELRDRRMLSEKAQAVDALTARVHALEANIAETAGVGRISRDELLRLLDAHADAKDACIKKPTDANKTHLRHIVDHIEQRLSTPASTDLTQEQDQ